MRIQGEYSIASLSYLISWSAKLCGKNGSVRRRRALVPSRRPAAGETFPNVQDRAEIRDSIRYSGRKDHQGIQRQILWTPTPEQLIEKRKPRSLVASSDNRKLLAKN